MGIFQGLLLLAFGLGLLGVDLRALTTGRLPCGSNGLRGRLWVARSAQPAGFWLMFALYGAGGAWLAIFALRLLAGTAEPLPLR